MKDGDIIINQPGVIVAFAETTFGTTPSQMTERFAPSPPGHPASVIPKIKKGEVRMRFDWAQKLGIEDLTKTHTIEISQTDGSIRTYVGMQGRRVGDYIVFTIPKG